MGKHKKKFINKKEAVSFHLIHRSQRDPLQADNEASQRILHPISNKQDLSSRSNQGTASEEGSSRQEENAKYGIYFDDDYDYMQHLRERGEGVLVMDESGASSSTGLPRRADSSKDFDVRLKLPPEVLASEFEEDEGMLNKGVLPRGPQPDWDPDIVACLDDALDLDDPDNILEDNFILMANGEKVDYDREDDYDDQEYGSDDFSDGDSDFGFSSDDDKSQGTRYSMTSSVIRRTQELKILDDRFDKILEEYDDDEIGGLDDEEITGYVKADEHLGNRVMNELLHQCPTTLQDLTSENSKEKEISLKDKANENDSDSGDEKLERLVEEEKLQWDCESILSTHSTLYNHPKLICEPKGKKAIQLTKKHGIPVGVLKDKKIEAISTQVAKNETVDNTRDKNETQEEKKLRKQAVKEERRRRRVEKKATKELFKSEHTKQEKVLANAKVQQGLKI